MIDKKDDIKKRYCGYCREYITDYESVWLQHLNYCELRLVHNYDKKKGRDGGKLEAGEGDTK